jgi:hypothetical protein
MPRVHVGYHNVGGYSVTPHSHGKQPHVSPRAPSETTHRRGHRPLGGITTGTPLGLPVSPSGYMGLADGSARRAHRWFGGRGLGGRWEKPACAREAASREPSPQTEVTGWQGRGRSGAKAIEARQVT